MDLKHVTDQLLTLTKDDEQAEDAAYQLLAAFEIIKKMGWKNDVRSLPELLIMAAYALVRGNSTRKAMIDFGRYVEYMNDSNVKSAKGQVELLGEMLGLDLNNLGKIDPDKLQGE